MADQTQTSQGAAEYARTWLSTTQHIVKSKREDEGRNFKWHVRTKCKRTLKRAKVQTEQFERDDLCRRCEFAS